MAKDLPIKLALRLLGWAATLVKTGAHLEKAKWRSCPIMGDGVPYRSRLTSQSLAAVAAVAAKAAKLNYLP